VNVYNHLYTYDGNNNLTNNLAQDWIDMVWVNNHMFSFTYDGNNNQTERLTQHWNGTDLLAGKPSGESQSSLKRWLQLRHKK